MKMWISTSACLPWSQILSESSWKKQKHIRDYPCKISFNFLLLDEIKNLNIFTRALLS